MRSGKFLFGGWVAPKRTISQGTSEKVRKVFSKRIHFSDLFEIFSDLSKLSLTHPAEASAIPARTSMVSMVSFSNEKNLR